MNKHRCPIDAVYLSAPLWIYLPVLPAYLLTSPTNLHTSLLISPTSQPTSLPTSLPTSPALDITTSPPTSLLTSHALDITTSLATSQLISLPTSLPTSPVLAIITSPTSLHPSLLISPTSRNTYQSAYQSYQPTY